MKVTLTDYLRYALHLLTGYRAVIERKVFVERERDIRDYLDYRSGLLVLDLCNGYLRPQYTLLKAASHRVAGIDIVNSPQLNLLRLAYLLARILYKRNLGLPMTGRDTTLVCGNVINLPFKSDTFDLVTSVASFEHFLDVPAVLTEVRRVLRHGGLLYASIHVFTSPSGGHNVKISEVPLRNVPKGVDPWDHLRNRRLPFHVPLNEWRPKRYLQAFTQHFEILKHYCAMREGEELLTPEIEAELSSYTRDELTCGAYVIVARKPT